MIQFLLLHFSLLLKVDNDILNDSRQKFMAKLVHMHCETLSSYEMENPDQEK